MVQQLDYRSIIKSVLLEHTRYVPVNGDIKNHISFDEEQGNYVLLQAGWNKTKYIHSAFLHVELKGEKIWIHCDGTEYGVANELVEAGVPKDAIVLGFRHPYMRPYTDFAVA